MRQDKEEIQGSDWRGSPMNKCSFHLFFPPTGNAGIRCTAL